MRSKNVIGVIGRLDRNEENQFDAETFIKQCQNRLKTDPTYKQSDFDMDQIRCKVLKMPPNPVQNVQKPNNVDTSADCFAIDDDFFNDLDTFTPNHYDNAYADRFSSDSLSMMNLATPESQSLFFY